jgi:exocyst complex component 4
MAQVVHQQDGRDTPNSIQSEDDSGLGHAEEAERGPGEDQYATRMAKSSYDSQMTVSPPLGSLSRSEEPAALGSVLNALTQAGRKKGQARMLRGTTADEESKRRKSERKVEMARKKEARPLEHYIDRQDERPFREICAVLRKVQEEWGFVVEDDFNSVALALSLLDDSSLGANKREFLEIKEVIEKALQGTVDGENPLDLVVE